GVAVTATVTALDQFNNIATGYAGVVHFTSNDAQASLPADATLTGGAGTFNNVVFKTVSLTRTLTATDTASSGITGVSGSVNVSPAAANHFTVGVPASATAGGLFSVTVTALDAFNNTDTNFAHTVVFTSSDTGSVTLPLPYL